MSIVDDVKPILDEARAIIDDVGLREFRVFVRTTDWTGNRPGIDTKTTTLRELTVARGGKPKVVVLNPQAVVASGGELGDVIYEVTLTPKYPGGGVEPSDLTPLVDSSVRREVHYLVIGPGANDGGDVCAQLSVNHGSPFRAVMRLRKTGAR